MPLINYKPSNWKSGETRRNVITLTARDSLLLRGAESTARSRLQISAYHPIDYPRATTNFRPLFPSPPCFSISVEINRIHEGRITKKGREGGIPISACQHGLNLPFSPGAASISSRARIHCFLSLKILAPPTTSAFGSFLFLLRFIIVVETSRWIILSIVIFFSKIESVERRLFLLCLCKGKFFNTVVVGGRGICCAASSA